MASLACARTNETGEQGGGLFFSRKSGEVLLELLEVLRSDEPIEPNAVKMLLDLCPGVVIEQDIVSKETPLSAYCAHQTQPLDAKVLRLLLQHTDRGGQATVICNLQKKLPFQVYQLKALTVEHPDAEITRILLKANADAVICGEHSPHSRTGFITTDSVLDQYLRTANPDEDVVKAMCDLNPDSAKFANSSGDLPIATYIRTVNCAPAVSFDDERISQIVRGASTRLVDTTKETAAAAVNRLKHGATSTKQHLVNMVKASVPQQVGVELSEAGKDLVGASLDLIDFTQAGMSTVVMATLDGVGAVVGSIDNLKSQIEIEQSVVSRTGRRLNEKVVKILVDAHPEGVAGLYDEVDGSKRNALELYCQPQVAGEHKEFQPNIFSTLASHLPMKVVIKVAQRPQVFPKFARLTVAFDYHELEKFVEMNIANGSTLGIMSCVPFGGAAQYGMRATPCIELQTNIYEVLFDYMIDSTVPLSRRMHVQAVLGAWIHAIVCDSQNTAMLMYSGVEAKTLETFAGSFFMQTATTFMWLRGPKWVFVFDFTALLFLVVIMSMIVEEDLAGDYLSQTWEVVIALMLCSYLFIRDCQLAYELRRQDLVKFRLYNRDCFTQMCSAPLTFFGLSRSYRTNLWNWMSTFMLLESVMMITAHVRGTVAAGAGTRAIMILVYHSRLIAKFTNANESYAVFVYMMWNIVQDISMFCFVLSLVFFSFSHFFYVLFYDVSHEKLAEWESHCDDGSDDEGCESYDDAVYPWTSIQGSFQNSILIGLGIEGPNAMPDQDGKEMGHLFWWSGNDADTASTFLFIVYTVFMLVIFVSLMNILIAIVSDSYDDALSRSNKTFWVKRMDLCAETGLLYKLGNWSDGGWFPNYLVPSDEQMQRLINLELKTVVARQERPSKGKFADLQRKISKDTEHKTRRIEAKLDAQNAELRQMLSVLVEEKSGQGGGFLW